MKIDKSELEKLRQDWERRFRKHTDKSLRWKLNYYWSNIQYRTLLLFRLSRAYADVQFIGYLLKQAYRSASISSGLEFFTSPGGGMIIPHFGPIKLNADKIGKNLYVFHNVTIGNDYATGRPVIGDNVFISTHCVIIGKIHIGDNVVIGANSLVDSDIPSNSLAAGNPARVIRALTDDAIQLMIKY
jgi:serine acetyltransferase